jgi:hypothetical protein
MDDAARVRDAAREALADIEPPRLRDALHDRLDDASMAPAVFSLLCARALGPEVEAEVDAIAERAAGVQLIYEGLSLTRSLVRSPPWESDASNRSDTDLLVANILVARGFSLLAHTRAADRAVETVRSFAREETAREADPETGAGPEALETDVFELAIIAGVSAAGATAPPGSRALASDLVASLSEGVLPEGTDDALETLLSGDGRTNVAPDGVEASSAVDF